MLEPWNNSTLLPPPVSLVKSNIKVDTAGLKHVGSNIIRVLSKQSPLHKESAICSRFLYKYDMKFRHDIGYRNLKKVNTALRKYLKLNLLKDIDDFLSALPSDSDDEIYLPTQQMLEYILLRVMAFSKIMLRISICSKQAGIFYLDRVKRGESHWMSLLPYALVSRLWSMSMVLLQHSSSWYLGLYPYLNVLQPKGLTFLPTPFELPQDLEQWLDLKNIEYFGRFAWAEKKLIKIDPTLIDDDEHDMLENILDYVNQTNDDEPEIEDNIKPLSDKFKENKLISVPTITQVDHGEVLSRESYRVLFSQNNINEDSNKLIHPSKTKEIKKHSHESITDSNSIKQFIDSEEQFRNDSNDESVTSHLSFMQWQALKNASLNLCNELTNRKIQRKFQKLWKEKCLDYL